MRMGISRQMSERREVPLAGKLSRRVFQRPAARAGQSVGRRLQSRPIQYVGRRLSCFRIIEDRLDTALDLIEKRRTESGAFRVVIVRDFIQFSLGQSVKTDFSVHLILDQPSRKTSAAGRPESGWASIWASLRWASSAHN